MCLLVNTLKCGVADEDIIVYKYVSKFILFSEGRLAGIPISPYDFESLDRDYVRNNAYEVVWGSPYRCIPEERVIYRPGNTIVDSRFQETSEQRPATDEMTYLVYRGLHAFSRCADALTKVQDFAHIDGSAAVMLCVIPKGARYWANPSRSEYCSETLEVKELIYEKRAE